MDGPKYTLLSPLLITETTKADVCFHMRALIRHFTFTHNLPTKQTVILFTLYNENTLVLGD